MNEDKIPEGVGEFAEFLCKEVNVELYDYQIEVLKKIDDRKRLIFGRRGWMWI